MIADHAKSLIATEIRKADERYGPFHSTHEGLGVLVEEFEELKDAIRSNGLEAVAKEAIDVAAVATRIAVSLDDKHTRQRSQP